MAIYRTGTFAVPAANAATTLNLGFIPSEFRMWNITRINAGTTPAVNEGWWNSSMGAASTPFSMIGTWTAGANVWSKSTTNGILSFQSSDAALFTPQQAPYNVTTGDRQYIGQSTLQVIDKTSNITQAAQALVTTGDAHSFTTAADVGVTVVTFHGVPGMTQINGLTGTITSVPSTTTFTVSINTSNFSAYNATGITNGLNSGFFNVITGAPANTVYGFQSLPTSEANLGFIGLTIGTDFMAGTAVVAADTWFYSAILQSPVTGP